MKNHTSITVLLDRSGSMGSCRQQTIDGFNAFLKEQKSAGDNADITLVQFDSQGIDTTMDAVPIAAGMELSLESFVPRANTPLHDALGKTIVATGARFGAMSEDDRPDKVVFVIVTDGQENASTEYKRETIKKMIEAQESAYKWQFVYLGANQDAFAEASSIGVRASNAANYATRSSVQSFGVTGQNVSAYRGGATMDSLSYNDDQRKQMAEDDTK